MKNPQKYSYATLEQIDRVRAKRQAVLAELNGCERLDRYNVLIKELKEFNKILKDIESVKRREITLRSD